MYTRFKSQKTGLKLGLNTISNPTTRARVAIPAAVANSSSSSTTQPITGKAKKKQQDDLASKSSKCESSLNSSSSASLSSLPGAGVVNPSIVASTASVMIVASSDQDLPYSINSEGFPLTSIFPAPKSSSHKKDLNRHKSHEDSSYEEVVDPATISYVKSLWEKYTSEIGTQNGPQRHVDDAATEYPHLNGFVPFDLEDWWAQRSISSMINEKSLLSNDSSPTSATTISKSSLLTASTIIKNDPLNTTGGLLTPSTSSSSSASASSSSSSSSASASSSSSSSSSVTSSSMSSPTQLASPTRLAIDSSASSSRSFDMNDLMNAFTANPSAAAAPAPYSSVKSLKFVNTTTSSTATQRLNSSNLTSIQACFS